MEHHINEIIYHCNNAVTAWLENWLLLYALASFTKEQPCHNNEKEFYTMYV